MISTKKRYQTTADGLQSLREHLAVLYMRRKQLTEELRDLVSQNSINDAMYDYAQTASHTRVNELEDQIETFERIVSTAVVITPTTDKVSIGSRVTIRLDGSQRTYTIVGNMEADPLNGKISDESPFGKALIGRRIGDSFELSLRLDRTQSATVVAIEA